MRDKMKISKSTIQTLSALSNINAVIKIHVGNKLRIRSLNGSSMAYATINDTFDHEFVIYDISRFIAAINLVDDAELEFSDKYLIIKNANTRLTFSYGFEETVVSVPSEMKFPEDENNIHFDMNKDVMENLLKGCSLFGLKHISVVSEKGSTDVHIKTHSMDGTVSNGISHLVGETKSDIEFCIIYPLDSFSQMVKGDYKCDISPKGISHYTGETIEYYMTIDRSSTFTG